jgi:hypothetical protein
MRLLAQCVPGRLEATALTVYGTVGIGLPTALLIIGSGQLYSHFGANGFFVMAALCAAALPSRSKSPRARLIKTCGKHRVSRVSSGLNGIITELERSRLL